MLGFPILASAALKGSAILGAASLVAWSLRRRSAAARHLVWTAAAAALLALPVLMLTLPALRVIAPQSGPGVVFQVFSSAATGTTPARPAAAPAKGAVAWAPSRALEPQVWIFGVCAA